MLYKLFIVICLSSLLYAKNLTFSASYIHSQSSMLKNFDKMLQFIDNYIGIHFDTVITTNTDEFIEQFKQNNIDIAIVDTITYDRLLQSINYVDAIVGFKSPSGDRDFTCSLISMSNTININEIKDKRFVYTNNSPICGNQSLKPMLEDMNLTITTAITTYDDIDLIMGVILNEYDIGLVRSDVAQKYKHMGVKILTTSTKFVNYVLVYNKNTIDQMQKNRLFDLFSNLSVEKDYYILKKWGESVKYGCFNLSK